MRRTPRPRSDAAPAVFGLDDDEWGQRVCAGLVRAGRATADRLVEDVAAFAAARLAPYKRPKQYGVKDELPRTETGKLQRNRIPRLVGLE